MLARALAAVVALALGLLLPGAARAALTHSWPGEGNALDVVGAADGTHTGTFVTDGFTGKAFAFGGLDTTDFGDVGDPGSGDFTAAFAVRTTQTDAAVALLTKRATCDASQPFWDIHMGPTSVGYETYETLGAGNQGVGVTAQINDGFWHTLTFTRSGSTLRGYVDGEQRAERTDATANVSNGTAMRAGTSPCVGADTTVQLVGALDEVRLADSPDPDLLLPPALVNTALPVVSFAAIDRLGCSSGTWRYPVTAGITQQWLRDGVPIDGATGEVHPITAADEGHLFTCRVVAANQRGTASAVSEPFPVLPVHGDPPFPPPVATPVPQPVTPAAPAVVTISRIATLPPAKACVSRRRFPIRLRGVKAGRIVRAQIRLNGRQVRNVTGKALGLPIDLRGLPKGRFTVEIVTTDSAGKQLVGRRTYRTCVPKRS